MGFFEVGVGSETDDARGVILALLGRKETAEAVLGETLALADRYLRLNPDDAELRRARKLCLRRTFARRLLESRRGDLTGRIGA